MNSSTKCFLGTAAVALVLSGIVVSRYFSPPSPPLREVPAGELIRRDGLAFWKDDSTPFTGIIIEAYPDGSRKSRSALSNGLMHGASEGWYTNGVLQVREQFQHGVSHGLREKWFASGAKLSETTIEHGQLEGLFKRWHENGSLAEEVQMKKGHPHGISTAYHPDGSLKARVKLENGKVIEQEFWSRDQRDMHAKQATGNVPAL